MDRHFEKPYKFNGYKGQKGKYQWRDVCVVYVFEDLVSAQTSEDLRLAGVF